MDRKYYSVKGLTQKAAEAEKPLLDFLANHPDTLYNMSELTKLFGIDERELRAICHKANLDHKPIYTGNDGYAWTKNPERLEESASRLEATAKSLFRRVSAIRYAKYLLSRQEISEQQDLML